MHKSCPPPTNRLVGQSKCPTKPLVGQAIQNEVISIDELLLKA